MARPVPTNSASIGYVGLGTIGLRVARRLLSCVDSTESAPPVMLVFDTDAGVGAALERQEPKRVHACASVAEVAAGCSVLFCCLPDVAAAKAVMSEVAAIAQPSQRLLVVDNSTVDQPTAVELRRLLGAKRVEYLECPVLGGAQQASDGTLFPIVSGAASAYVAARPLIERFSTAHRYVGARAGAASLIKTVQNGLGLVQWAGIVEALGMIAKAGGGAEELRTFYEVVSSGGGMADTPLFRTQASRILGGDDSFSAFLRIGAKDIGLAAAQARAHGVDPAVFAAAEALFAQATGSMGLAEADITQLSRVVEERFGVSIFGAVSDLAPKL